MQCSGGIFLLGGGNLTRSNFDHSENCYLVGVGMNLWFGGDLVEWEQKFGWGGRMSKFSASGGILPPVGKTLISGACISKSLIMRNLRHIIFM